MHFVGKIAPVIAAGNGIRRAIAVWSRDEWARGGGLDRNAATWRSIGGIQRVSMATTGLAAVVDGAA